MWPKNLRCFKTKILHTVWGPTWTARAKEIVFCLLCQGHHIALMLIMPHQWAVWLAILRNNRGLSLVTAQAIWEVQ